MNNKELNLLQLLKLLLKNKMLFAIVFSLFCILSMYYVLNIEKTYQSVLVAKFPLNDGLETEYLMNELSTYKSQDLNQLLELKNNKIKSIHLDKLKHASSETYSVIRIETFAPDTSLEVKNKLMKYINELDYFNQLMAVEKAENEAIKETRIDSLDSKNYFFNPLAMTKMVYMAKENLMYLAPIVEIKYTVFTHKHKPSYAMLIILSVLFSVFMALSISLLKIGVKDILKEINDEK